MDGVLPALPLALTVHRALTETLGGQEHLPKPGARSSATFLQQKTAGATRESGVELDPT